MSKLYERVCDELLEKINSGALKVGDRLPPEEDYAAQLGISRSTLRLAFAELESSGVLRRKKRAGTEIISNAPKKQFNMATGGISELLSIGNDTEFVLHGTRTVRTEDVPELEGLVSETGYWLEVFGARSLPDEARPFSVNRVYVPARFAAIEPVLTSGKMSVYRKIEETFGVEVGRVSQLVTAISCPAEDARLMGLPPEAPALRIEAKLYLSDGALMELSLAVFDPNRFQVRTDVTIG